VEKMATNFGNILTNAMSSLEKIEQKQYELKKEVKILQVSIAFHLHLPRSHVF
jgi:hypothetical protein